MKLAARSRTDSEPGHYAVVTTDDGSANVQWPQTKVANQLHTRALPAIDTLQGAPDNLSGFGSCLTQAFAALIPCSLSGVRK